MSYEPGGRANKSGNKYEAEYVVYCLLDILKEKISYIIYEPLGDDQQGIDLLIENSEGIIERQQCKGSNGGQGFWCLSTANKKNLFKYWKIHLERDNSGLVTLVSPLPFPLLGGIINRAKDSSENADDFFNFQIGQSGKKVRDFFENFCNVMDIDPNNEQDKEKCMSYLKRIKLNQIPEMYLSEMIKEKIDYLISGNVDKIFSLLFAWVQTGNILGGKIDQSVIYKFLKKNKLSLKSLANDSRIKPQVDILNNEFKKKFFAINDDMIDRKEFSECRKIIDAQESLIIHGQAGRGKSGCTIDIIEYCENNKIPFIAVKLDTHIPQSNTTTWGKDLGLPASITHCLHSISKTRQSVIILDQLDTLRWTHTNFQNALSVCAQVIREVERLNNERIHKISLIFVCRTYDLENVNVIKSLFYASDDPNLTMKWNKIKVHDFDDVTVKNVVGKHYDNLSNKLKEILRVPSNLYIWQHLDPDLNYTYCTTESLLISKWLEQLSEEYRRSISNSLSFKEIVDKIVSFMVNNNSTSISSTHFSLFSKSIECLSSSSLITVQNNRISFIHQTIFDYFLADKMLNDYYISKNIVAVIGEKKMQSPPRRYQLQMFLERLVEDSIPNFINAGIGMFESESIRFSFKYVFLEVLSQIELIDENIEKFVIDYCENKVIGNRLIETVIKSREKYVRLLLRHEILHKWYCGDGNKKDLVIDLLYSIYPYLDLEFSQYIEEYIIQPGMENNSIDRLFLHDINQDTDDFFEIRMKFYRQNPSRANQYTRTSSNYGYRDIRFIRILSLLLNQKKDENKKKELKKEIVNLMYIHQARMQ